MLLLDNQVGLRTAKLLDGKPSMDATFFNRRKNGLGACAA